MKRLLHLCVFALSSTEVTAQCSQIPPSGLLPSDAIQDCGSNTAEGALCPFNCSNGFSQSGQLLCQSGAWQAGSGTDAPRCLEPCLRPTLAIGYGQSAQLVGYADGFWPSPSEWVTTTTTTLLACDVEGAQSCLQSVVGITDIQEFCSRLPGAMECLKAAECCESSGATIRSSIGSCEAAGRVVENPCSDLSEQCALCLPSSVTSDVTAENCDSLRRVPFCMRSQGCCDSWLQGLGLAELAQSCRQQHGTDISRTCEETPEDDMPLVSNEGAQVRVACESPRFATASGERNYVCENSSFTSSEPAVQCLDPACPLEPHPAGAYECTLQGQSVALPVLSGVLQVPFRATCSLKCNQSHELPLPPAELQCAYVEGDFNDVIYADSSRVSRTGIPRMVRRIADETLMVATQQVCEAVDCPVPQISQPVAFNNDISQDVLTEMGGMLYLDCVGLSQGSLCLPRCADGFAVDPLRPQLRCDAGRFRGTVRCTRRSCSGAPTWSFGSVGALATWPTSCDTRMHGESCEVSCATGFMRDQRVPAFRCEAGEWLAPVTSPCIERSCSQAPVVSNAIGLQACANRPHGYQCPVRCISGYTSIGSVQCVQGVYVASGVVCTPQPAGNQEIQTESVTVLRGQVHLAHVPQLVSLQGRLHVAAMAALDPENDSPKDLARQLAREMPDVSPHDLALGLGTSPLDPSFALRAAMAADVEVMPSLLPLALTRLDALELWSQLSYIFVAEGSHLASRLASALRSLTTAVDAAGVQALAADAGAAVDRTLELHRFAPHDGAGASTAQRQYDLGEALDPTELENLRLNVLGSFRDLDAEAGSAEDFHEKLLTALRSLDLEDTPGDVAAAMDVAVRTMVPGAMEDVTAAAAMTARWQMRSACSSAECEPETLITLLEAGREGAQLASWRTGLVAPELAAAAASASAATDTATSGQRLATTAGALSVFGVRKEELQRVMPSATQEEIQSAFWLSQLRNPRTFLQQLSQTNGVTGLDLALLLADDAILEDLTPMEGEFALSWAGDPAAGALLRARLSGASADHLSAAHAAVQAPASPSALASSVASALPSDVEVMQRCIITRAVAVALGWNATWAAHAAAFASGFNEATYLQSLQQVTATDTETLAQQVKVHADNEPSVFRQLSFAFAVALEKLGTMRSALRVVQHMQDSSLSPMEAVSQLVPLCLAVAASLSDVVIASLAVATDPTERMAVLGHSMWLLSEKASGPIFQSALMDAAVSIFEADDLVSASFTLAKDTSWISITARRIVEQNQGNLADLAAQVPEELSSSLHVAGVAHFAAVYAAMNATEAAQTLAVSIGEAAPSVVFAAGLWAAKWPARADPVASCAKATAAAVEIFQQEQLQMCPSNETGCESPTTGCAVPTGLSLGPSPCSALCAAQSSVEWPRRCVGFVLGSTCEGQLQSCDYTVTQQDLSNHSSGLCVCSDAAESVHAAAENVKRLARFSAEMQSWQFLAPKAFQSIAPQDVILEAQALNPVQLSDVPVAVLEIIGSRRQVQLTPEQVAYATYRVASLQGFNRSEAALAAVEVTAAEDDENLAPLADALFFLGLDLEEARELVVETAWRLPRVSARALRQAFWRFQQLEDASRQLRRSRILQRFEGDATPFRAFQEAKEAFGSLQAATADAMAAGAEAAEMLSYHMASGYSYEQALKFLGEVNITEELELTGQRLSEQLALPEPPAVDSAWLQDTGSYDTSLFADEAYLPYIQEALAHALGVDPAQVDLLGIAGVVRQSLPTSTVSFAIKVQDENATALSQQLENFPSNYGAFFDKLKQVLADDLPMPSIFSTPRVTAKHLEVVSDFQVPVPKWLATSEWSTCPALCGAAWQFRDVKCSSGNDFACSATGTKLPTEQSCEVYVDCPFEWTCPLGGRDANELACGVQFLLVAGGLILLVLLFWLLVQVVRRCCRCRPRTGQMRLIAKGGQSMKVNFYIVQDQKEGEKEEHDTVIKTLTNNAQEEQKTKVVWDIDVEKAQRLEFQQWKMQKMGGELTDRQERALKRLPGKGRQIGRRTTQELLQQHEQEAAVQWENSLKTDATTPRSAASPRTPASQSAWSQSTQGEMPAPYRLHERVEYFSTSLGRWMAAEIYGAYSECGYDVMITSNRGRSTQLRREVPLHLLRPLILEGELVSAFWNNEWYQGHVLSKSHPSNSYVGYSVKLTMCGEDMCLQTPNVWRRFPKDAAVQIFDDSLGWMSATVHSEAEMTEPFPSKDTVPTWFDVEVIHETGEKDKVPGYRVQREKRTL